MTNLTFPHRARFESLTAISSSYLILRLHSPQDFEFKAGQHVTLHLKDETGSFQRTYSIASPPSLKPHLEFCIQVQEDERSAAFYRSLHPGVAIQLSSARGQFQIQGTPSAGATPEIEWNPQPARTGEGLVFIAGGSGISPLRSMILEYVSRDGHHSPLHLLYGCKEADSIPFLEEFVELSQKAPFHPLFFAESLSSKTSVRLRSGQNKLLPGRVTSALGEGSEFVSSSNQYYLCGPPPMIQAVEKILIDSGILPDRIHRERY